MIREDAIDVIKCLAWHTRPNEEDIEQAIRALEQEPCNDAISRQAVLEWLIDKDIIKTKNQEENARRELAELPSVTPQQEPILDEIRADIQKLRGCSCRCSDGIIDDVEDILDKYKAESEGKNADSN